MVVVCNTVDFTDCQYGGGYGGRYWSLSISINADPQCAAGVNSPVLHPRDSIVPGSRPQRWFVPRTSAVRDS